MGPDSPNRTGIAVSAALLSCAVLCGSGMAAFAAPAPSPGPSPQPAVTQAPAPSTTASGAPPTRPVTVSDSVPPIPGPTAMPSATSGPALPPADPVLRVDGHVDPAAYRTMATELGSATGIAYRFGAASSAAPASDRPTAVQPPDRVRDMHGKSANTTYQVGGSQDSGKDDYSSNQGQVGYLSTGKDRTPGLDHLETLSMSENTFSEQPRLSWTYYGAGHPDPDIAGDGEPAKCMARLGVKPGRFVAQARAYSHGELTANTLAVFDNGVIAAAGTNTARGRVCVKLPARLHPSAISITNGNEFALVTAWNTKTLTSELAVIALGGSQPAGTFWNYEWSELYPGFQNYGMPTFAKFLGAVPLPVATAVGVSAVSNTSAFQWPTNGSGNVLPGDFPLSNEANRQTFISGANSARRATAGYAVVFSRAERKVVFVDLQPLFQSITGAYFRGRGEFDAAVRSVGTGPSAWPQDFSVRPSSAPVVVKTVSTIHRPTAAAAMLSGASTPVAYVATENGRLHTFAVGGLADSQPASASQVRRQGAVTVGRNPTAITYVKDHDGALAESLDSTLVVTSRGDRQIVWVDVSSRPGRVVRVLRDSRLVDPIAAEDNNNHGTESYVLSVADYGAARLFNYRYGPVIFHTNGGARFPAPAGGFEFGGSYAPRGRPFSISVTNVT